MNWSADEVAEVPLGVMTVTSTVSFSVPGGETAVTEVSLLTVTFVAAVLPNQTLTVSLRYEPVIVTVVPPRTDP